MEEWVGFDARYRLCDLRHPLRRPRRGHRGRAARRRAGRLRRLHPARRASRWAAPHYVPLYEAAEANGLPIVVHPTGAEGNLYEAPRLAGGLPDTYPERHALLLQPGQAILASMIFGGVFERFPKLKLVLSEYGFTWAAPMISRWTVPGSRATASCRGCRARPARRSPTTSASPRSRSTSPEPLQQLWDMLEMIDAGRIADLQLRLPALGQRRPGSRSCSSRLPEHLRRPHRLRDRDRVLRRRPSRARPVSAAARIRATTSARSTSSSWTASGSSSSPAARSASSAPPAASTRSATAARTRAPRSAPAGSPGRWCRRGPTGTATSDETSWSCCPWHRWEFELERATASAG